MPDTPEEREREIAELRARLAALESPSPPTPPPPSTQGQAQVGGDNSGQVVGVNTGIAIAIFGKDSREEERRQLGWYLGDLTRALDRLPLQGIEQRLSQEGEPMTLSAVYTALRVEDNRGRNRSVVEAITLPTQARRDDMQRRLKANRKAKQPSATGTVILGAPGSGKSTFVRHLALMVARRALEQPVPEGVIPNDTLPLLSLILPLQQLARALVGVAEKEHGDTVEQELIKLLPTKCDLASRIIGEALHKGAALLLFDGLDEVPLSGVAGEVADRKTTVAAVKTFVQTRAAWDTPVVVTCRTQAFTDDLRRTLGWDVATLAPFADDQIRQFVPAWYRELARVTTITDTHSTTLLERIESSKQLREMAGTPLLLTMMALVLYNKGELPRDRPKLYESILDVLLGQWDKAGKKGQTLGEAVGLPDWDSKRFLPMLDRLSYEAHRTASSADGRGRLPKSAVRERLITFFEEAGFSAATAMAKAGLFLDYIEQRSGLLSPDSDETYVFAHLTFQEHCAGHDLVIGREPLARILTHRSDDRWREPIFLGLGVVQPSNPFLIESVLRALVKRDEGDAAKPVARWYRDLILAAELGNDRDWAYLRQQEVDVRGLQQDLRQGLATLLGDPASGLEQRERIRAGVLLGELGDPRYPTTLAQWQAELAQRSRTFGQPNGYFCYVPAGTYAVGGWGKGVRRQPDTPAVQHALQEFWIARYPITNAQFRPFVAGDGYTNKNYWTTAGWQWRTKYKRTAPRYWDDTRYNQPNQPVVGVTWYEAMAYAAWLTGQLVGALPEGYEIRLPTEAEWEVAAAYDGQGTRRMYPWGDAPDPDADHAIFEDAQGNNLGAAAAVGVCAAGAAACGAADMAGNVFEWCASSVAGYPQDAATGQKDFTVGKSVVPLRGGSWYTDSTYMPFGARSWVHPDYGGDDFGLRVVCAPCLR